MTTTYHEKSFSSKVIDFTAVEKAKLATLLNLLAESLYGGAHENLTEAEVEALLEDTDHFQHRLLGRDGSPK